ncbi:OmpP1/FadL family transporter [Thiohalorhabdus sp. Cl-TMA]|uniref:OmpP1/FadL family transporter n=1 Tax=Thiohalorhabdus methylotrophus TaxID=3242694 RepID=A0ABV4TRE3_9GAMM
MRTNRIVSAALAGWGAIGLATTAHATNGYQLIGVGAYQKGMGGAVTANPGSAMTAITNPAGMAAVGNRADFSMELFMPDRYNDFTATGGDKQDSEAKSYGVPAIGWTAPVSEGSDFYFGGGMYGTSGLGVDYGVTDFVVNPPQNTDLQFTGYSNIAFWQAAPTLAWRASDRLKVGISLNLDYQSVAFQERISGQFGGNALDTNFNLARTANAFGYGISAGLLYDVSERVTVGFSYKSPQSFEDLEFQLSGDGAGGSVDDINQFPNGKGNFVYANSGTYKMDLDYPQQAALGIKVQPVERLKVSADVKWINWSATLDDLAVTGGFDVVSPAGSPVAGGAREAALDPGWDDQIVYAVGADYAATDRLRLRAGFNYSQTPIDQEDVFANAIFPAMVETHLSLGATYLINRHWDVSLAFMKAFENEEKGKGDIPESFRAAGFSEDSNAKIALEEETYSINVGYRF